MFVSQMSWKLLVYLFAELQFTPQDNHKKVILCIFTCVSGSENKIPFTSAFSQKLPVIGTPHLQWYNLVANLSTPTYRELNRLNILSLSP
jgi:hypothetical protein